MIPVKGQTGLAWIVILAIVLIGLSFIVTSAFSQDNAPASINGRTATTTHNLP
jgi:uncharacterized protein involved in outer membrane biogenesis